VLIDRAAIAALIPHAGDMCLLDEVVGWDGSRIACVSMTHRSLGNPLRRAGRIGILCGVEYAAQAMALHGALAGSGAGLSGTVQPRGGYLASLRAVSCYTDRLDRMTGPLLIETERLFGDADRMIYRFALRHETQVLLDGRAVVVREGGDPVVSTPQ
jgi:predicted hotdog family 3-hydroxylacyl-ACP dehydratase